MQEHQQIILFDGHCNLCSRSVRFIKKRDKENIFTPLPLNSKEASKIEGIEKVDLQDPDSVIYARNGRFYYRSEAAIRIMAEIGGAYKLLRIFLLIPPRIRDFFYDLIARNRHRFFKDSNTCSIGEGT